MLASYLRSAKRILFKEKLYTIIHTCGLAAGLATCFAIYSWVSFETSFDKQFENADSVYRIITQSSDPSEQGIASTYPMVKSRVLPQFPEVEVSARFYDEGFLGSKTRVKINDKVFTDVKFCYADQDFTRIFPYNVVAGDLQKALSSPHGVIISRKMTTKLFGTGDVLGKVLVAGNGREFQVTCIIEDIPENTHLHFDILAPMEAHPWIKNAENNVWSGVVFHTYVQLKPGTDPQVLESGLRDYLDHFPNDPKQYGRSVSLRLQPLRDIHLQSNLQFELEPNGSILYAYVFATIGVLVLLLAVINYVNLATARHLRRYKEVAVRKSLGATSKQLILQFIIESSVVTLLAVCIAMLTLKVVRPQLVSLFGSVQDMLQLGVLVTCTLIVVFTALATGVVPAALLSRQKPVQLFRSPSLPGSGLSFRKVLLVTQFTTSIALTICTLVAYRQMKFIGNADLGYNREQVVILNIGYQEVLGKYKLLKSELMAQPVVIGATATSELPTDIRAGENIDVTKSQSLGVNCISVDRDFFDVMGIHVLYGKDQIRSIEENDSVNRFVMNESTLRALHMDDTTMLNQPIRIRHGNMKPGPVIGVVSDFHFQSLHHAVGPLVLEFNPDGYEYLLVKVKGDDMQQAIDRISNTWNKVVADIPFEYAFLDERYDNLYKGEQRSGGLLMVFSALALVISLLGLFGLTSFAVERRTKEIGVRKILGARAGGLLVLIGRDFMTLLIISFVVALPIGYLFMSSWLQRFATRTEIDPLLFLLAGIVNILCAMLIVSFHGLRIASTRPVDTLRDQ